MKIKAIINPEARYSAYTKFIETEFPEFLIEENPDIYLAYGGDGAMLRAIQLEGVSKLPFLGKALGTLNFLMNEITEDREFFIKLKSSGIKLDYIEFKTISVSREIEEKTELLGVAINDVVIGNNLNDYHEFFLNTLDNTFSDFPISGTGICISTTLGSTAYNFNNGGMILPLDSKLWSVTGIVCNRHLNDILPEQKLTIRLGKIKNMATVYVDGIEKNINFIVGTKLVLKPAGTITIAFVSSDKFIAKRLEIAHRFRK